MRLKSCQYELESDLQDLNTRLAEIKTRMVTSTDNFKRYKKLMPVAGVSDEDNEIWLDEVRKLAKLAESKPDSEQNNSESEDSLTSKVSVAIRFQAMVADRLSRKKKGHNAEIYGNKKKPTGVPAELPNFDNDIDEELVLLPDPSYFTRSANQTMN